jgi:hypothetical protein
MPEMGHRRRPRTRSDVEPIGREARLLAAFEKQRARMEVLAFSGLEQRRLASEGKAETDPKHLEVVAEYVARADPRVGDPQELPGRGRTQGRAELELIVDPERLIPETAEHQGIGKVVVDEVEPELRGEIGMGRIRNTDLPKRESETATRSTPVSVAT